MQLRAEQLEAHLAKTLAPLYVIHGDEPLLALEAADAVRAAARARGYAEREVFTAERGFDWSELAHARAARCSAGRRSSSCACRPASRAPRAPRPSPRTARAWTPRR
jgi:DNA polymerase-3 subunit delta